MKNYQKRTGGRGGHSSRRRSRGRKPTNFSGRNIESNGPEVKIRGSASQIADKYLILARDAQSSGDPVMSENYLQHAEHYQRVISLMQLNKSKNSVSLNGVSKIENENQEIKDKESNKSSQGGMIAEKEIDTQKTTEEGLSEKTDPGNLNEEISNS